MTDINLFRDPIWQFVGAVLSLFAIVASVWLFFAQRRTKSLACIIQTNTPLLSYKNVLKGRIAITVDGSPVKKVSLLEIAIHNDGSIPITKEDFVEPLHLSFGDGASILSVDIVDTSPSDINPVFEVSQERLTLNPLLLNQKDRVDIKLLVAEMTNNVNMGARIQGVRELKRRTADRRAVIDGRTGLGIGVLCLIVIGLVQQATQGEVGFAGIIGFLAGAGTAFFAASAVVIGWRFAEQVSSAITHKLKGSDKER